MQATYHPYPVIHEPAVPSSPAAAAPLAGALAARIGPGGS
jgi:hypothetical protein